MDMHAKDLVGINDITRILLVYTCQQGVYPRGHVIPLILPLPFLFDNIPPHIWLGLHRWLQQDSAPRHSEVQTTAFLNQYFQSYRILRKEILLGL
jgi:hypothetical protein